LGVNAGKNLTTGSGNVCIGQGVSGLAGESNTTRIRNVYASMVSGRAVYVNSNNKTGTLVSSRRFKDEIKPMDKASESILALKPVTFRYKKEIEPNGSIMFGLIAEEVEKVNPKLVTCNDKGEAETVRYDAVNANVAQRVPQRAPHSGRPKERNCDARSNGERAGRANPKGEHTARRSESVPWRT
jgi:Chaperone of endosialidase